MYSHIVIRLLNRIFFLNEQSIPFNPYINMNEQSRFLILFIKLSFTRTLDRALNNFFRVTVAVHWSWNVQTADGSSSGPFLTV